MLAGCATPPWYVQQYADGHKLARVVYEEATALETGHSRVESLLPLLVNTNAVFREVDGSTVTIRDVAFTILQAAGEVELPDTDNPTRSKFIYCCTENGELLYRAHIPVLSEDGFQKTIETIQQLRP